MNHNKLLIYRKKTIHFNSIENVFSTLAPFLTTIKVELPYPSNGVVKRIKNILFIQKKNGLLNHITGHDHYLAFGLKRDNTILTIHDIEILKRNKGLKHFLLKKLWFDFPMLRVKMVTTISEFSKQELLSLNNYNKPIIVIHNPLTLPIEFSPKVFNQSNPVILHIGTKLNKNLERLIDAIENINCQLVIIGQLNNKLKYSLNKKNISYLSKSNLSNDQIIQEYKNCDLLSFVSTYEGFGLPIIEAQAMGRPVITSNITSMPEVARNSAHLVNPYSIEEIRNGIKKIINNSIYRTTLIEKGLENIKRFSPEKIANEYKELYEITLKK